MEKFIHDKRDLIFGSLGAAKSVEDIETIFTSFGIEKDAYDDKANALIEFQQADAYSSPSYKKLSSKERYRNELGIFLTFEWKKSHAHG